MAVLQWSSRRDVVFSTSELSSIIGEVYTLDRRISGVIWLSFGTDDIRLRTGCALSRTGCTYGRASSSCRRASSTCCHASLHTAAHRPRTAALRLRVSTHLNIRPRIERTSLVDIALLLCGVKYCISYSRSANSGSFKIGFRTELIVQLLLQLLDRL